MDRAAPVRTPRWLQTPVPLSAFTHFQTQSESLSIAHQGQFPAVTISFNLGNGYSLGQALDAMKKVIAKANLPASVIANYQGTAAAFEGSLSNEGLLILAALVTVYIVLGVLYESFVHPDHDSFNTAIGGRGRAAGAGAVSSRPRHRRPSSASSC